NGLAEALDWPLKAFRRCFQEVSREPSPEETARGHRQPMAKADWKARFVWLPRALEYNRPESPNVVTSWRDQWDLIPECPLKLEAWNALREGLSGAFLAAFLKSCRKPFANDSEKALPEPPTHPLANQ